MAIESHFNPSPLENPLSGDPSVPHFSFTESERQRMLDKGMSEEQITAKEVEITNRQVDAKREAA